MGMMRNYKRQAKATEDEIQKLGDLSKVKESEISQLTQENELLT
jgi:hypothetical protein